MKAIVTCICLFTVSVCFSQKSALVITNLETRKERVIKENKRIRITLINTEKLQGRFKIVDQNTIALDGEIIALSEIVRIKRHPLFNTIFIKSNLIHIGSLGLFFGVLGTTFSSSGDDAKKNPGPLIGGVVFFAAGIYGAIKEPNLNKGYNSNRNWQFKINLQ